MHHKVILQWKNTKVKSDPFWPNIGIHIETLRNQVFSKVWKVPFLRFRASHISPVECRNGEFFEAGRRLDPDLFVRWKNSKFRYSTAYFWRARNRHFWLPRGYLAKLVKSQNFCFCRQLGWTWPKFAEKDDFDNQKFIKSLYGEKIWKSNLTHFDQL